MRTASTAYHPADIYLAGGLPEQRGDIGPWSYARRLARYISDPSTVRVRVLEQFGYAPSVDDIARSIADFRSPPRLPGEWGDPVDRRNDAYFIAPEPKPEPAAFRQAQDDRPVVPRFEGERIWRAVAAQVAARHGYTLDDITGPRGKMALVRVRNCAAAVLVARGASHTLVGRWFGGRDHSTLLHGLRSFLRRDIRDFELAATFLTFAPPRDVWPKPFAKLAREAGL